MTVSLEGYLEPQRISFGSPPMSHRPFSFDESCQPFSPPLYGSIVSAHRRQSSIGFYSLHWNTNAILPRRSLSISSHHTCNNIEEKLEKAFSVVNAPPTAKLEFKYGRFDTMNLFLFDHDAMTDFSNELKNF